MVGKTPSLSEVPVRGTKAERILFADIMRHYMMSKEDLDVRRPSWDKIDELFRSYIDADNWPYNSVVFDPRVFTFIFEKTSRLLANKLAGRMVPREGGDALGARINNELLMFQWDENERVDAMPMLSKWAMMDGIARKYGASFALCKYRYERGLQRSGKKEKLRSVPFYDGPDFKVLSPRDVLANPSYSTIKNWFQYREYVTLDELLGVNDLARGKPIYKNLDILRDSLKKDEHTKKFADTRASNYDLKNKTLKGLQDYLGRDDVFKVVEVVTEYRRDRWISFAPKHGIILRDIPNPYDHQQIPVVMLKYYCIDDDLYGLSEVEPVERIQRGINALVCQYLDSINMSLYTPLKVRAAGVQMHTLEFGPGKKWIMNDPQTDVMPHESSIAGVTEFTSTYRFLVGALQEAVGETSAQASNLVPGREEKTATEIRASEQQKNARDNFNQLFLKEAIKKQMMFWHAMNKQFMFSDPTQQHKVIRIVGRDAIRYFQGRGLDNFTIDDEQAHLLADAIDSGAQINPQEYGLPQHPVDIEGDVMPKLTIEEGEEVGHLILTPEDLSGNYDFIPDVEAMQLPTDEQQGAMKRQLLELARDPNTIALLQREGTKIKMKELLEDAFEDTGLKDAEKYFEKVEEVDPNAQAQQAGGAGPQPGAPNQGNVQQQGMAANPRAVAQGQARPGVS
jgi:hypothetical protein